MLAIFNRLECTILILRWNNASQEMPQERHKSSEPMICQQTIKANRLRSSEVQSFVCMAQHIVIMPLPNNDSQQLKNAT